MSFAPQCICLNCKAGSFCWWFSFVKKVCGGSSWLWFLLFCSEVKVERLRRTPTLEIGKQAKALSELLFRYFLTTKARKQTLRIN